MSQEPDAFDGRDPRLPGALSRASAEQLLRTADELAARGEYEQAVPYYRRVIGHRDADLHVAAALGLADALYRIDDEEGALQSWIVAASAPETPLSWKAWKQLAAARVRQGDLVAATRAYREAERRAPAAERPEIASRLGWLNKEMGNDRQARRYFSRSRDFGGVVPYATYGVIAVTVAIGLFVEVTGGQGVAGNIVQLLLLDKARVAAGEWYRLVTVVLLHGGILHLAFNMYALYLIGPIIEGLYGRVIFLGAYVLTAAAGSTLSFLLIPNDAVGASGAIFGLFGMLLVTDRVYRPALARQARAITSQIGMIIGINLLFGFGIAGFGVPIDNFAHIGGLLGGAWLGLIVPPRGVTLGSFWQGLSGRRGAPPVGAGVQGPAARGPDVVLLAGRVAGVALLVMAIAIGVAFGSASRRGQRGTGGGELATVTAPQTVTAPETVSVPRSAEQPGGAGRVDARSGR